MGGGREGFRTKILPATRARARLLLTRCPFVPAVFVGAFNHTRFS